MKEQKKKKENTNLVATSFIESEAKVMAEM